MYLNGTHSKVRTGIYLSNKFSIKIGLKQGNSLSLLLLNFALKYTTKNVQENQVGLKLRRTHQLLVYADDMTLLGDNIDTIKKNTESLTDASKEVGLEVSTEKTKNKLLSYYQNAGCNHDINIANKLFENVAQFKNVVRTYGLV
jgi:hypothetical protein